MELSELTWNEIKKEWTVVCNMLAFLIIRMAMSDHVILGGGPPFIFYCLSGNINVVHYVMVDMYGIYTKCLLYNNNIQTNSCFRCYITFLKTFYSFSVHLLILYLFWTFYWNWLCIADKIVYLWITKPYLLL